MSVSNTHYGAEKIARMLDGKQAVYFLGIGGITMSSLAHITKTQGFRLSNWIVKKISPDNSMF